MLITSLIAVIILLVCVALLSISILIKKNGKFPDTHIEGNKTLRDKGIYCAASQDYESMKHKNLEERIKENN
ncbi:hypothetical protein AGMMS49574_10310 [Bacteroidia bacterium]|nr:hypothetical protein AGMMS49574_10310 [Bacteroidia bacterium]